MTSQQRSIVGAAVVAVVFVAAAMAIGAFAGAKVGSTSPKAQARPDVWMASGAMGRIIPARYVRPLDGDTQVFRLADGSLERVRMIGADCPEADARFVDFYTKKPLEYAHDALRSVGDVYLELGTQERDKHGQLLAYVWLVRPGTDPSSHSVRAKMLNARMLADGYAKRVATRPGITYANTRYSTLFDELASDARSARRGMWDPAVAEVAGETSTFFSIATPASSACVGNRRTHFFHRPNCKNALKMRRVNRVELPSRDRAIELGFKPCGICEP